jgi:hypothetical protein
LLRILWTQVRGERWRCHNQKRDQAGSYSFGGGASGSVAARKVGAVPAAVLTATATVRRPHLVNAVARNNLGVGGIG